MPHSRSAAQHSLSRAFCPATSRPPSVVTSVRFSGTRHTSCGRTWRAIAIISSVAAISRFMRVCSVARKRCTSWSWMWRRSSRRCSVMLSAPDCSATSAACSGIGIRRAARLPQRRDVVDVDAELDGVGQLHWINLRPPCLHARAFRAAPRVCAAAGRRATGRAPPAAAGAHRPGCAGRRAPRAQARAATRRKISGFPPPLHRSAPRRPRCRSGSCAPAASGSPLVASCSRLRPQPSSSSRRFSNRRSARAGIVVGRVQALDQDRVGVEQRRMRIVPLQQLQQQFVGVEAAHQAIAGQRRGRPYALGRRSGALPRRGRSRRPATR